MAAKDVRPGDLVVVRKAGDVIPEVVGPVTEGPDGPPNAARRGAFPPRCPACGSPLLRLPGESDTYCTNIDCPAQRVQRIAHFGSRSAMDIEGLGEQRVVQLVDAGLLGDPADLYGLTAGQLGGLEGFAAVSTRNLLDAIDASRQRPLSRLLVALGIRHVGPTGARALARAFGTCRPSGRRRSRTWRRSRGSAPSSPPAWPSSWPPTPTARARPPAGRRGEHDRAGSGPPRERRSAEPGPLAGKSVVVTGTVAGYTREEAEAAIVAGGGKSPGSVSKRTFAVVVGDEPGASKLSRAESLGVPVSPGSRFDELLGDRRAAGLRNARENAGGVHRIRRSDR